MMMRLMLVLIAIAGGVATYYAGRLQGIDERWPNLAAAFSVGILLVLFLHLFVGEEWKERTH